MPPKKKQSEETKKLEQYRKDVIKAMIKLKKANGRNLLYDKGDNWNKKISGMKSDELSDFKDDLLIQLELESSPEEAAKALSSKALKLKIVEPHVTDSERLKEEVKEEISSFSDNQKKTQDVKEPLPVSDPPNKPLIDSKEEKEPAPVSDPPNKPLIDSKEEVDDQNNKEEPSFSDNQKKTKTKAEKQKDVRQKDKDRQAQEKEAIAKTAEEKGIQIGIEQTLQKIAEGKIKAPPLSGTLPPVVESIRSIAPIAVSGGVSLISPVVGKALGSSIKSATSSLVNRITEAFRSRPDAKITVNIPSIEYKFRAIPLGLQGFYKYMNKYLSVYNRLKTEQKTQLEDIDRKLMTIKQSQTRSPQNTKSIKNLYNKINKIVNEMDKNINDEKALDGDIKSFQELLDVKKFQTLQTNINPALDNRLQLGLGQVMEMRRGADFLPILLANSASQIAPLSIPEIVEAVNSVVANITEIERGGLERVGDTTVKIPQITEEEAVKIKDVITKEVITEEKESKDEPEKESKDEPEKESKDEPEDESKEPEKKIEPKKTRTILRRLGKYVAGAAGVGGLASAISDTAIVSDTIKNIYSNIMETPIKIPETQAQSDQKISSATGTMRPRFIVPSRDSVIPSMPKIRADDIQFAAFDYVQPGTEGGNGNARTNPLVLSQELEERLRYTNAGIRISPGMGENVVNITLTESELKALLLPRGPDISPVIYEFPIIDGDQSQNEVKKYDQNLIQVEKFSPYNEYNDNQQLDEEIYGSILLSYVP
jgi:hypothetical protein